MSTRHWAYRALIWLGLGLVVLYPASLAPGSLLVGHPDVDVWNHAWGYWFVPHSLAQLQLPLSTPLVGAPDGGDLYFIDMLGALIGAPLAWIFGAAVAYNGVLLLRVAAAGLAAQCLTEALTSRGPHTWLAGAAFATTPYLLSELSNGITEVATVHWLAWTLLAAHRVREAPGPRRWRWLGLSLGLCAAANFYYGLVAGMMVLIVLGWDALGAWRAGHRPTRTALKPVVVALVLAAVVALPFWGGFQWTLHSEGALVVRPQEVASGWMLTHNAVDPRTFFAPGDFQSVDLTQYGEAFRHTGYLRWTLMLLALVGAVTHRALRPWLVAGLVSGIIGLGPFLWWGEHLMMGGRHISLPFYWLQFVLPDVAITHTLRLAAGAQLMVAVLGAAGWMAIARRLGPLGTPAAAVGVAALVMAEGAFLSPAEWPVPTSDAAVPAAYEDLGEGPVLDLPGSVGATMATSQYFWFQTSHGRPVPWSPNVRLDSCRDLDVQGAFTHPQTRAHSHQVVEDPASGPDFLQIQLLKRYAAIVVHTDLEARAKLPSSYGETLTKVLGPPEAVGDLLIWRGGGMQ